MTNKTNFGYNTDSHAAFRKSLCLEMSAETQIEDNAERCKPSFLSNEEFTYLMLEVGVAWSNFSKIMNFITF